jgi:antitoxin component of MazEF toxin-antitoxin module
MTLSVRLTSDRKIQLPETVIKKMNLSINDEIIMEVEDNKLVMIKKEVSKADTFSGLTKKVWNNSDAEEYLKDEGNCGDNSGY